MVNAVVHALLAFSYIETDSGRSGPSCVHRKPQQAGPGKAPALRGPSLRKRPASTQATNPPPAPMGRMSIDGNRMSTPQENSNSGV